MRRALAIAAIATGCAPSPVVLELGFPTSSAFVQSSEGRIRAFPLGREQLGICPDLLNGLASSRFPIEPSYDSERIDVCTLRSGVEVPGIGQGPHAFVVEIRNETTRILEGCAIGEVYAGAGTLPVALHPTESFDETMRAESPDERCARARP